MCLGARTGAASSQGGWYVPRGHINRLEKMRGVVEQIGAPVGSEDRRTSGSRDKK
jgi:hypothetical protein